MRSSPRPQLADVPGIVAAYNRRQRVILCLRAVYYYLTTMPAQAGVPIPIAYIVVSFAVHCYYHAYTFKLGRLGEPRKPTGAASFVYKV